MSDIAAVPGEPPPKGDVPPTPAPIPEATPEPTPESTPEPPPPPVEKPEFVQAAPTPLPPKPKVAPVRPPQPSRPPSPPHPASTPAPATAGTASGTVGAHGGGRGDFIATPHPEYDFTAMQRHYQGGGEVLITYANGAISNVEMAQSTGVSYLDARTVSWVKSRYRVKPGASGSAHFHIDWVLPTAR